MRRSINRLVLVGLCSQLVVASAFSQTTVNIHTNQRRSIGGASLLDREKFFTHSGTLHAPANTNLGDLNALAGAEDGLNASTGRIATEFDQFIAMPLPEDNSRPGFIDPTALRNQIRGPYRNFVLNGSRYRQIRENNNSLIVNSGRYGTFFPSYFFEPGTGAPRIEPYTEFLNIYLEETVYGPNAFYPADPERFHVELLNEPDLHFSANFTREDYVTFHREVAEGIRAVFPQASVGGPSLAVTGFEDNEFVNGGAENFSRFENRVGNIIAGAGEALSFYSIHPYERYNVQNNGSFSRQVDNSPGRTDGLLDLIAARDLAVNGAIRNGTPLPISLTEYGSFNVPNGNGDFGNYTRSEQQWDLTRDVREQLLVYLERPDLVLSATPFVAPRDFRPGLPTSDEGDNVFFEQLADGQWQETIVAQTFRSYANVSGEYIGVQENSGDLQAVAFRDGNEVYVLLNNLLGTQQTVDLNVFTSLGDVQSATIDRLFRQGANNIFIDDQDITNSFESIVLNPEEGSVVTLTLSDNDAFSLETEEQTFYSLETILPFNSPTGSTDQFSIDATVDESALSATLRLTYNRPAAQPDGEGFRVLVNSDLINVPSGVIGEDDGDFGLQTRDIEVPVDALINGENTLIVDFNGGGGNLASAALIVVSDINFSPLLEGDFNDDGVVDAADYTVWRDNLGAAAGTLANDSVGGVIGTAQYELWRANFGATASGPAAASNVPEPSSLVILGLGFLGLVSRNIRNANHSA